VRPKLLDLFCGAGGAAMGYHTAGFDVVGVDLVPQPRYPFEFHRGDAPEFLAAHGREFDAIHASPPCQAYSKLRSLNLDVKYPDLVAPVRALLEESGRPWVIENVPGAPLGFSVMLCGAMFGLRVYRHRYFETSFWIWHPPHPKHVIRAGSPGTKGGRGQRAHYEAGGFVTVVGNVGSYCGPAMGIDWMSGKELSQAIPPAYTNLIGESLLKSINLEKDR
jgi:DNA (cytosine-5)-methyltransferase 1